jgi:hypothetical protein
MLGKYIEMIHLLLHNMIALFLYRRRFETGITLS